MKKNLWRLNHIFLLLIVIFSVISCVKNDVLENVVMDQAFSLPLGDKELAIEAPPWNTSTEVPGLYGTFYYNGRPYPVNVKTFHAQRRIDFNMDSISKVEWIQRLDLKIKVTNSYPVNSYFQIYLVNEADLTTDSVFTEGYQKCEAGEVDNLDDPVDSTIRVFEASFTGDRLERLKQTKYLSYHMWIETEREDKETLRFSSRCNINLNLAMRLFLRYKLQEITD